MTKQNDKATCQSKMTTTREALGGMSFLGTSRIASWVE